MSEISMNSQGKGGLPVLMEHRLLGDCESEQVTLGREM